MFALLGGFILVVIALTALGFQWQFVPGLTKALEGFGKVLAELIEAFREGWRNGPQR